MNTTEKFSFYTVKKKYIRNLQNIDKRVPSVSPQNGKLTRIFLGIIIMINGQNYCIPFSSYDKRKYQTIASNITLRKIYQGNKLIAVLNINNMIPVSDKYLVPVDVAIHKSDNEKARQRKLFYQYELDWCNQHQNEIEKAARDLYRMYCSGMDFKKRKICLDYPALERECNKSKNI